MLLGIDGPPRPPKIAQKGKKGKKSQNMRIKHSVHVKYDKKLRVLIKNDKN